MKTFSYNQAQIDYLLTEYDDFLVKPKRSGKLIKITGSKEEIKICFQKMCNSEDLGFLYYEVKPSDIVTKILLKYLGFYYCNTTCKAFNKNIDLMETNENELVVHESDQKTKDQIKQIMTNKFGWGRIYEDIHLHDKAVNRMQMVIDKLICDPNVIFITAKDFDKLIAYYIYVSKGKYIDAKFAGVNPNEKTNYTGKDCFRAFHKYIHEKESMNYVKTSISLSNLGILNLYSNLGYTFHSVVEDFHYYEA